MKFSNKKDSETKIVGQWNATSEGTVAFGIYRESYVTHL